MSTAIDDKAEEAMWGSIIGHDDEAYDIGDPVWREVPATLDEFVEGKAHLGLPPLFPAQREAIVQLLGADSQRVFEKRAPDDQTRRQLAVLLWGKGSGKDYLCSILVCYAVHILLCLRDPQDYFEFGPSEPIDVINVAYNADQAKFVFFAKLKARLLGWVWLHERFNVFEAGRARGVHTPGSPEVQINADHVLFPRSIRAFSRHAQNESYEGLNIIVWIMDEASAFLSKLERENAEAIYSTLRTSSTSRFPGRWIGAIISWPRHGDDFTMTKVREAKLNPDAGTYADGPRKTWEVNTRVGGVMVEVRPGHWVPDGFVNDYREDFENAVAKYECEPPSARDAFFRYPEYLESAVQTGRAPLIEWEPYVTTRHVPMVVDGAEVEVTRRYSAVRLTKLGKLPRGAKLYFHGDPGLVNDSFALALGHAVPATVMVRVPANEVMDERQLALWCSQGHEPTETVEWERDVTRAVIDAVIVWRPDPRVNQQVDMMNVQDVIFELRKHYRIGFAAAEPTGTFDHWESAEIVQRMIDQRMNVENESWSRGFQVDIYRTARSCFYNDLVTLPDTPSITSDDALSPGALYELKRIEFIDGSKVDHPERGSKDIADAIVRVIQHCAGASRKAFQYGTALGHTSQYPGRAAAVPVPGRTVDPRKPPSPVTDALREAERLQRLAAPLGELDTANGTINGRRFASISTRRSQ